jgi:hypothetical protein
MNVDAAHYGDTFAILNEKNEVVPCGEWRAKTWWFQRGGWRRSTIRIDCIGNSVVETSFTISSRVLDGPHLFWRVSFYSPPEPKKDPSGGFMPALMASLAPRCATLEEALHANPPFRFEQAFGTLEAARQFHMELRKRVRAHMRLTMKIPEKSQEFLVELAYWCRQKWGRQAMVARSAGTTPQTVNDWLNGRKKMTGEQVLRVQELLRTRHSAAGKLPKE